MSSDIRVLHVDDEPDFAEMVSTFLSREDDGIEVFTETAASDALERLSGERDGIDCVVSDYEMPEMDGLELLEEVRDDCPNLPFILFTGKGSEEVASEAISAGVTDYLQKESGVDQYTVLANRVRNAVEMRRNEHELRKSRKRLNLFFEKSPLGVVEWDDDFRLVRMNERAEEILGYEEAELRGETWKPIVPESDKEEVDEVVRNLLENRGGYHSINENVTKDGEKVICEWHNRVVTDESGETIAVFSQFYEVTGEKEYDHELHKNERRFEAVFEDPGILVGLLDTDGTVLRVNSTAMEYTEVDEEEVTGKPFWETPWWQVDEELREDARRWTERAAEGEYVEFEAEHVLPDGGKANVSGVFRPVTEDGEVTSLVVSARDITERKEREKTIRERNETLEDVASFLSHDMRTPLTTARGRMEMAAETDDEEHFEKAFAALDRLEEMLTDMTDVLRTGDVVGETEEVELEESVEEVTETVQAPESISFDVTDSPTVVCDEEALRRLLENLVSNSVEHDGEGVEILVGETEDGFYYEDDGSGIPENNREDVFKPGYTTKKGSEGTGMGLASVRQIVVAHGWEIDVHDAEELEGVRFEIRTHG